ncbi:hypothetical protein N7466_007200 [Penicillium verhagenii]|uniref:uncharacterized protein n=1 Tax=Penicillium verhagenii TaxID=1562060 RepID=UPI002544FCA5|nr:uncharacterized protein N7466_007200 [Penicillium verhagenii]KAJ5928244.1 hypothetical protein N7466_007200 [Penicillium verhagenii]
MVHFQALVLDFGQVVSSWKPSSNSPVPPKLLKELMTSEIWLDYERGHLAQRDCYAKLSDRFGIASSDIAATIDQARQSIQTNHQMLEFVQELSTVHGLKIYGMTNTPRPEQSYLQAIADQYGVFEEIFVSGNLGMRKPELGFYRLVIEKIDLPVETIIFVDDNPGNVQAAKLTGMTGLVFRSVEHFAGQMEDPLSD